MTSVTHYYVGASSTIADLPFFMVGKDVACGRRKHPTGFLLVAARTRDRVTCRRCLDKMTPRVYVRAYSPSGTPCEDVTCFSVSAVLNAVEKMRMTDTVRVRVI